MVKQDAGNAAVADGAAPADGNPPAATESKTFAVVLGLAFLAVAIFGALIVTIDSLGWATPVSKVIGAVAVTAAAFGASLVVHKTKLVALPWWAWVVGALVGGIFIYWAYSTRDSTGHHAGDFTSENRKDEYQVSADGGERYVFALAPHDDLEAVMRLYRGRVSVEATEAEDGALVVDETLPRGQWTIAVRAINDTVGSYDLDIDHDDPRTLGLGDHLDGEELTDATDSNGYRFDVDDRRFVYVGVRPTDPNDLQLDVKLFKRNGFIAANPRQVGFVWQINKELDGGTYVLAVETPDDDIGSYSLELSPNAPSDTPVETTIASSENVRVPDVVEQPESEAIATLLDAGFAPRAVNVCSSSVGEGIVRQVVRMSNGEEIKVVELEGVVPEQSELPAGTELLVKVGTGSPCDD